MHKNMQFASYLSKNNFGTYRPTKFVPVPHDVSIVGNLQQQFRQTRHRLFPHRQSRVHCSVVNNFQILQMYKKIISILTGFQSVAR